MFPEIRDLEDAGSATADLLIDSFFEVQLLEQVRAGYEEGCRRAPGRFAVEPRQLDPDDFRRMLFEVVCFAVYAIMADETSKYFGGSVDGTAPDAEELGRFNTAMCQRVEKHLSDQGIDQLNEVTVVTLTPKIQFGSGVPLKVPRRIADYTKASTLLDATELFARYLGFAVDPQQAAVLKPVWLAYVETIIDIERLVLETVAKKLYGQ